MLESSVSSSIKLGIPNNGRQIIAIILYYFFIFEKQLQNYIERRKKVVVQDLSCTFHRIIKYHVSFF